MNTLPNRFRNFTLKSLITAYVFFFVGLFLLDRILPGVYDSLDTAMFPLAETGVTVVNIAWLWYFASRARMSFSELIGAKHFTWKHLGYAHLVIPLLTASVAALVIIDYYVPALSQYAPEAIPLSTPVETIGTFLVLVVIAPITEEIMFRKVLLHGWSNRWRVGTALTFSAILFGLLHFDIFGALLFGIVLGIVYIKTRNLIAGILIHALNNLWVFIIMMLPESNETATRLTTDELVFFHAVLAIDLLWIVLVLYIFRPQDWSLPDEQMQDAHNPT